MQFSLNALQIFYWYIFFQFRSCRRVMSASHIFVDRCMVFSMPSTRQPSISFLVFQAPSSSSFFVNFGGPIILPLISGGRKTLWLHTVHSKLIVLVPFFFFLCIISLLCNCLWILPIALEIWYLSHVVPVGNFSIYV